MTVVLSDGTTTDLDGLDRDDLHELQFHQERAFAQQILAAPPFSPERAETIRRAYDTVTTIHSRVVVPRDGALAMGLSPRYVRLVIELLRRAERRLGGRPRFFELGFGAGLLLEQVAAAGYDVAGIEVSSTMHEQAIAHLRERRDRLFLGDFLTHDLAGTLGSYDVVYWNDVLEHVPPDEALDYARRIHRLLAPGGCLVTITPNWHERPSDVTGDFRPPRTEAEGLHLKEYTLRQTTRLFRAAGFERVATPLFVVRGKIVLAGNGAAGLKRLIEPALEWAPYRLAERLIRGFGFNCTVAWKWRV